MIATTEHGTGPGVLWLHGYAMDSSIWAPLWQRLPGWRHVGLDLPGHGGSPSIPPGMSLSELAGELATVARDTGARRVVALSFGSLAGVQLAIEHPDLVERLVLAAPTLGDAEPDPQAKRRYAELMLLKRMAGVSEGLVDRWMASPPDIFRGTERHPPVRAQLREVALRHSWAELGTTLLAGLTTADHGPDVLARITADTLVLVGDEDMPTFVDNARRLERDVGRCRVVTVERAGHLPLLERPEAVAGVLAEHLG